MKTLITRTISAIIAGSIVSVLVFKFGALGLQVLCGTAVLLGVRELARILFHEKKYSFTIKAIFSITTFLIFALAAFTPDYSTLGLTCVLTLFLCLSIVFESSFSSLTELNLFQAKSILGFFYIGLLPAMAFRITQVENGLYWFILLLVVVLLGDTTAYLSGMAWGNKKIIPNISPKKTVVGAMGGLFGSILGAWIFCYLIMPQYSLLSLFFVGLTTGIVAQLGDFFESVLKRVANVKDSGTLMPGHGGVLDRIDGILFGAPIILFWALFIARIF